MDAVDRINSWRKIHESDEEWNMRREFIQLHYSRFPPSRLACLSSCFINVKCFGCRYSEPLMKQLSEMSHGLDSVFPAQAKHAYQPRKQIKFVAGCPDTNCSSSHNVANTVANDNIMQKLLASEPNCSTGVPEDVRNGIHSPNNSAVKATSLPHVARVNKEIGEKAADDDDECVERTFLKLGSIVKILKSQPSSKNDIETLQMAFDKCRMTADCTFAHSDTNFLCTLVVNGVLLGKGKASTKRAAKHLAFAAAVESLQKPYVKIDSAFNLVESSEPCDQSSGFVCGSPIPCTDMPLTAALKTNRSSSSRTSVNLTTESDINCGQAETEDVFDSTICTSFFNSNNFVILRNAAVASNECLAPIAVLQQSADFNKKNLTFDFCAVGDSDCCCSAILDGHNIGTAFGQNQLSAQTAASLKALNMLSKSCFSVIVKKASDVALDDSIQRRQLQVDDDKIPESNVGCMLLKKMGWTGGGVGKLGKQGIAEPVSVTSVVNRAGLGSQFSGDFAKAVNRTIVEFLRSDCDDLAFSQEFSNNERAVIHAEARKYNEKLKTKSYGTKESRYLVLSRRRSPIELVQHIRKNGGKTLKYILQYPTGCENP